MRLSFPHTHYWYEVVILIVIACSKKADRGRDKKWSYRSNWSFEEDGQRKGQ